MRLTHKFALGAILALLALVVLVSVSGNASADTHYTHATGNAADAATWIGGVPSTGDDLVFQGAYNIAMNDAKTYGTISLLANYSGVVTQGAVDFGYTDFSKLAGTWNGVSSNWQRCSGNFAANTVAWDNFNLNLTGTSKTFSCPSDEIRNLVIYGTISTNSDIQVKRSITIYGHLTIGTGRLMTLGMWTAWGANSFVNTGVVDGVGTLSFLAYNADVSIGNLGTINSPIRFICHPGASGNRVVTFTTSQVYGSSFTSISAHATYTMTVNLAGYSLTSNQVTLGNRGIIRNSAAGWSWLHSNGGFINSTGSGIFYTANVYYSWTNWATTVTSSPITTGQMTVAYTYSMTTNSTAKVTALAIPSWLTLSHNGTITTPWVLSGTPSLNGVYLVKIRTQSQNGTSYGYSNFSITVSTIWAPTVTALPATTAFANSAYSYSLTINETGIVTAISLPSWLTLSHNGTSTSPWVLSGSPVYDGNFLIKIKCKSSAGLLYSYENYSLHLSWSFGFTSAPTSYVIDQNSTFTYHITTNMSTATITTVTPWWMGTYTAPDGTKYVSGNAIQVEVDNVSIRATRDNTSVYQNFTLQVLPSGSVPTSLSPAILLSLGLLGILTFLAIYVRDTRPFSGMAWIILPMMTMTAYGIPVILITVVIGVVLIYLWAVE